MIRFTSFRVRRLGSDFSSGMKVKDGLIFVLAGRLRKLASGRVVTCQLEGRDAPPDCIVSAEFDRAWIEHPGTRAMVAEWSS